MVAGGNTFARCQKRTCNSIFHFVHGTMRRSICIFHRFIASNMTGRYADHHDLQQLVKIHHSGGNIAGSVNCCAYLRDQLFPFSDQVGHLGKLNAEMERPRFFDDITISNSHPFMLSQMLKPRFDHETFHHAIRMFNIVE